MCGGRNCTNVCRSTCTYDEESHACGGLHSTVHTSMKPARDAKTNEIDSSEIKTAQHANHIKSNGSAINSVIQAHLQVLQIKSYTYS